MAREKTITVDGKKITVRDRDFYLWTQYNRGVLTRAEVEAFQAAMPEDTSTHKTAQAVEKNAPAAEGIRGGPAGGPTGAPDPMDDAGIVVGSELLDKKLINVDEYRDLLIITRGSEAPEDVVGMAMESYGITLNELKKHNFVRFDLAEVEEAQSGGAVQQRRRRSTVAGWTEQFESGIGNIVSGIAEHFSESDKSKARMALRQGMEDNLDAIVASGDITRSEAEGMISRLGNPMNDQMLADYAGQVTGLIELRHIDDPEAVEVLTSLIGDVAGAFTPEGEEEVAATYDPGGPLPVPREMKPKAELRPGDPGYDYMAGGRQPGLAEGVRPGTLEAYLARQDLKARTAEAGYVTPDVEALGTKQDSPMAPGSGEYWYDKRTGQAYNRTELQRIYMGAADVANEFQAGSASIIGQGPVAEYFAATTAQETPEAFYTRGGYQTVQGPNTGYGAMPGYLKETFSDRMLVEGPAALDDWRTPTQFASDDPWLMPAYDYRAGSARAVWDSLSTIDKAAMRRKLAADGHMAQYDDYGDRYGTSNEAFMLGAFQQVLNTSSSEQISPWDASGYLGEFNQAIRDMQSAALNAAEARLASARAAVVRQPFSVPAHLRSVPDFKTNAVDTKARFRAETGRDPTQIELERMADSLDGYNRRSQTAQIDMAYQAYEGEDTVLDEGDLEEIGDPGSQLTYDVQNEYASEIDLNRRRESNADIFSRTINATRGANISSPVVGRSNVVGRQ